jgi:hypothetical protein
MPDPVPLPDPMLRVQREQTIAALCEHFAQDRLSVEELERRIDVAERAAASTQLAALLQDLPATPAAASTRTVVPVSWAGERPANSTFLAVMSGVERRGVWRPAARNFVIGFMGGVELDFREAELPPGETEVLVLALMGGVEIIVPPGLAVDASGIAIMGGFEHRSQAPHLPPGAARLRIHGIAFMGGVDVCVRNPGESAKEARRRIREEQRNRRRLRGS